MEFGRKAPDGTVGARWGARAIYDNRCTVDVVGNRQGCEGGTEEERDALVQWINTYALGAMRKLVAAERLETSSRAVVKVERDGFRMEASPNGSYGYLYLGAWKAVG